MQRGTMLCGSEYNEGGLEAVELLGIVSGLNPIIANTLEVDEGFGRAALNASYSFSTRPE